MSEPMTDEHLDEIRRAHATLAAADWLPAGTSHAHRGELLAEVERLRTERDDARAKLEQVLATKVPEIEAALTRFKQAVGVGPMPRQAPLTEAEARSWAEHHDVNEQARCFTREESLRATKALILAVDRGDVPPEVRPVDPSPKAAPPPFPANPPGWENASVVVLGHLDGKPVHARIGEMPAWVQQAAAAADAPPPSGGQTLPPWRPKVGDRVRTAEKLKAGEFNVFWEERRRAGAVGELKERTWDKGGRTWMARHDEGTEAPYDEDELRPAEMPRPRVGAWVDSHLTEAPCLYDDRGQWVAGVGPIYGSDRYSWVACRPFLPNATGDASDKAAAQAEALAVLETWCDVSAARVAVSVVTPRGAGAMRVT